MAMVNESTTTNGPEAKPDNTSPVQVPQVSGYIFFGEIDLCPRALLGLELILAPAYSNHGPEMVK